MKRRHKEEAADLLAKASNDLRDNNTVGYVLVELKRSGTVNRTLFFTPSKSSTGLHSVMGMLDRCKAIIISSLGDK